MWVVGKMFSMMVSFQWQNMFLRPLRQPKSKVSCFIFVQVTPSVLHMYNLEVTYF